jgi:hypothetical protein
VRASAALTRMSRRRRPHPSPESIAVTPAVGLRSDAFGEGCDFDRLHFAGARARLRAVEPNATRRPPADSIRPTPTRPKQSLQAS